MVFTENMWSYVSPLYKLVAMLCNFSTKVKAKSILRATSQLRNYTIIGGLSNFHCVTTWKKNSQSALKYHILKPTNAHHCIKQNML